MLAREEHEAAAGVAGRARGRVQGVAGDDDGGQVGGGPALAHDAAGPRPVEPEQPCHPPRRLPLDHRQRRRGRVDVYLVLVVVVWLVSRENDARIHPHVRGGDGEGLRV